MQQIVLILQKMTPLKNKKIVNKTVMKIQKKLLPILIKKNNFKKNLILNLNLMLKMNKIIKKMTNKTIQMIKKKRLEKMICEIEIKI